MKATVDKNRKGFAFLIFDDKKLEDAFVPPDRAAMLFPGDRVAVVLSSSGRTQSIEVLEHRFREVVGRFTPHPRDRKKGWVIYEKKRVREEIFVPSYSLKIIADAWVRAKLHFHEKGPFPVTAEILETFGQDLPTSADVAMISAEYSLEEGHTSLAEAEATQQKLHIPGKDLEGRKDLRYLPLITIDGETARDFDDAVFVESKKTGYVLWVAIADVSHYVRENTHLDQEARSKGTSVYFPERAFHMLPRVLSENLCSLKPNEPRLALVAKIEFDRNAKKIGAEIFEAVIESKRRATYNELQHEWEIEKNNSKWKYADFFTLYRALRQMRKIRGSIDFELPEAEVLVEPTGEVVSIQNRPRLDTHRLIEEFMIAANEAVTEWMVEKNWPFVYRVHEEPSIQSLQKFQTLAATVGIKLSLESASSPKVVAELVRSLEGHPAQLLLNIALLRSMKQAIYTPEQGIHYGLASTAYTHFTSPIRRYPDLVVHRLLRMALRSRNKRKSLDPKTRDQLQKELVEICEHCSYRERLAADAERESIKLKQVRLMTQKLGCEFEGRVVGMISAGIFVQLSDPYVEGMVSVDSMKDDLYEFNEDRMVFCGRRKKRMFKIGDKLKVKTIRADVEQRRIDFSLVI